MIRNNCFQFTLYLLISLLFATCNSQNNNNTSNANSNAELLKVKNDDEAQLRAVLNNYHSGFDKNNAELIRKTIADDYIMFNGNYSDDPSDWQAHQFLHKTAVDEWIDMMITEVSPIENVYEINNINIYNNAAIVVTIETGKNNFRTWKNEKVTYLFGKVGADWKMVGFFLKDMKNPD